jgi:Lysozyme like domain
MATGQKLSFSDIQQLWIANGGPPGWAPLMAGIAIAESGGNTAALNNTPATGDYSVGLWQINYYDGLLASRTNAYGSPAALQADPNLQAKAAISLFGGGPGITNWKGDATYRAWQAAGSPSQPSAATVQGWIGGAGGSGGGSTSAPSASSSAVSGAAGSGSSDLSQCVLQAPGFLFFSGPCFLTKGGAKAITSVALMGVGMLVGAFGVVALAAWGLDASGAKQAVSKVAGQLPGPTGKIIKAGGAASGGAGGRTSRPAPRVAAAPAAKAPDVPTAGRRESREIERNYRETTRQQGPIGPRGGNPTAGRIAQRERRGTSAAGARRQPANVRGGRPF